MQATETATRKTCCKKLHGELVTCAPDTPSLSTAMLLPGYVWATICDFKRALFRFDQLCLVPRCTGCAASHPAELSSHCQHCICTGGCLLGSYISCRAFEQQWTACALGWVALRVLRVSSGMIELIECCICDAWDPLSGASPDCRSHHWHTPCDNGWCEQGGTIAQGQEFLQRCDSQSIFTVRTPTGSKDSASPVRSFGIYTREGCCSATRPLHQATAVPPSMRSSASALFQRCLVAVCCAARPCSESELKARPSFYQHVTWSKRAWSDVNL